VEQARRELIKRLECDTSAFWEEKGFPPCLWEFASRALYGVFSRAFLVFEKALLRRGARNGLRWPIEVGH
jgi:hypothetical protein